MSETSDVSNSSSLQAIDSALSNNGNYNSNHNDSSLTNTVSNSIDLAVNTPSTLPSETGNFNLDDLHLNNAGGSFLMMPDLGNQTLNGTGSVFHLDQVNNLVNNGQVGSLSDGLTVGSVAGGDSGYNVADPWFSDPAHNGGGEGAFGFAQNAHATGGAATDNPYSSSANSPVSGAATTAATVTQEAFTQHVVLGSNVQYNSMPLTVVGGDHFSGIDGAITHS